MILSSGLAMIYGLRGVMNFAHGALYMLGAYFAYAVTSRGVSFWLALIIATFGIALVIDRIIVLIWGDQTHPVSAPNAVNGTTNVFGTAYPTYRLLIIGI